MRACRPLWRVVAAAGVLAGFLIGSLTAVFAQPQSTTIGDPSQIITYSDILAAPDDLKLNFNYARQEAGRGNLSGASTALERLLLLEPEWNTARLFYAVVLYRLDDLLAAERELLILSDRRLPEPQALEVTKYLNLIKRKRQRLHVRGFLGIGGRYDDNRNFATNLDGETDPILILGLPATSFIEPEDDFAYRGFAGFNGRYKLNPLSRHALYFRGTGLYNEQTSVDEQSFSDVYGEVGLEFDARILKIKPHVIGRTFAIDNEQYFTEAGGGVSLEKSVTPRFNVGAFGIALYQDFNSISVASIGNLRTGNRVQAGASANYALNARNRIGGRFLYDDKAADFDAFAYWNARIEVDYLFLLGRGSFLQLQGSTSWAEFDAPDPIFSPTLTRRDRRYVSRISVGSPLTSITGAVGWDLPQALSDLTLQVAADYRRQDSNIGNFSYDNIGAEANLIWNFEFGR